MIKTSAAISFCSIGISIGVISAVNADAPLSAAIADRPSVIAAHNGRVADLDFSPDGRTIASGGEEGTVKLWDAATRRLKRVLAPRGGDVWQVKSSLDGKTLAVAFEDGFYAPPKLKSIDESLHVALWDVATAKLRRSFALRGTEFTSVEFSPDGKWVGVCSDGYEHGRQATLWDLKTGQLKREINTERDTVSALIFAPDSKTIAVGGLFQKLRLWNLSTGKVKMLGDSDEVFDVSPDGKIMAGMDKGMGITLRNSSTGKVMRELEGNDDTTWSLKFSSDGKMLASGGGDQNSEVRLWDVASGQRLRTLKGHVKGVSAVAFSPDGKTLVSGGAEGTLRFWKVQ